MTQFVKTTVAIDRVTGAGAVKKFKEQHLVHALSFTEAEERVVQKLQGEAAGELEVTAVTRSKVTEILRGLETDLWFEVKYGLIDEHYENGTSKRVVCVMLVQGRDFSRAYDKFQQFAKDNIGDCEIISITETQIKEVYQ